MYVVQNIIYTGLRLTILVLLSSRIFADDLSIIQARYAEEVNVSTQMLRLRLGQLNKYYLEQLDKLFIAARSSGDLDAISEIEEEKKWLNEGRDLRKKINTKGDLGENRGVYLKEMLRHQKEWAENVIRLTNILDEKTKEMEVKQVKAGNIQRAKEIRDFRNGLYENASVQKAQIWLTGAGNEQGKTNKASIPEAIRKLYPSIPSHAVRFSTSYYAVYTDKKSWSEAKKHCEQLGGNLVSISTEEEQGFIFRHVKHLRLQRTHIGATDAGNEGQWRWIDNSPWRYENWGNNQPNNSNNGEHVAVMFRDGKWLDIPASLECPYICEWGAGTQE